MKSKRKEREYASAMDRAETHDSFERTAIRIPEGVSLFQPKKEGVYRLSVGAYIAGAGNRYAKKGQVWYERTYRTHRGVGPKNASYCCPADNFDKKCPIHEHQKKLQDEPNYDKELFKRLYTKQRQLFWIWDHDDESKGWQLWDISFHLFGKFLDKKIKTADPDDKEKYANFFHPTKGLMLRIAATEKSFEKRDFLEFADIEFKKRPEQFDKDIVDELECLDDLLIEVEYKKLKELFYQSGDDDEDEDEDDEPKKGKKKGKKANDEDDDEDDDSDKKKSKSKKGKKDDDDEEDDEEDEDVDEEDSDGDDDEDDDEDDPRPSRSSRKKGKKEDADEDDDDEDVKPKKGAKSKSKKDDDDDDDDDDEDDKPAKSSKKSKKEDDEDDEDEDDGAPVKKGQWVKFKHKGRSLKGKVTKVDEKRELVTVESDDRSEPHTLDFEDATMKVIPKPSDADEDEDDDEDEKPKKSSKSKKSSKDDDDEDEDEEDEKPAKKRKSRTSSSAAAGGKAGRKSAKDDAWEDEEDEDEDDDEEDEDEKPKKGKKSSKK